MSKYWNREGKYQDRYDELYEQHVPMSGNCETMGGEALRAVSRLNYDAYNNGWCNNTSGAWNFLNCELDTRDKEIRQALDQIEDLTNTGGYSDFDDEATQNALDTLVDKVVEYVDNDPNALKEGYDMFDLQEEDRYDEDDEDEYDPWGEDDDEEW